MNEYEKLLIEYENNKTDETVRFNLAKYLGDYLYSNFDIDEDVKFKEYLSRQRELLQISPEERFLFDKSLVAYIDKDKDMLMKYLTSYIKHLLSLETPLKYDDLFRGVMFFQSVDKCFFELMSENIKGDSESISLLFEGYNLLSREDYDGALEIFERCYEYDENNWIAIVECANIYFSQGNWKQSIKRYEAALRSNTNILTEIPDNYFDLAWCYSKIKDYINEEINYRKCLDLDSEYVNALNNLGYSLVRQKRYDEALEIFNECIEKDRDGKKPYYNKLRALKGLKRYEQALTFINESIDSGIFKRKSMTSDIEKIQCWIQNIREKNAKENANKDISIGEAIERDIENEESEISSDGPSIKELKKASPFATPNEKILEDLIEMHILEGEKTFNRNLVMYEDNRNYGRQLIIPDIGRIDLLAVDKDTNDLVVIELKQGRSDDKVVGQILRYMGWLNEKLAADNQNVVGIICVNKVSQKLKRAASMVPTIELHEYGISLNQV